MTIIAERPAKRRMTRVAERQVFGPAYRPSFLQPVRPWERAGTDLLYVGRHRTRAGLTGQVTVAQLARRVAP